MEWISVKDSSPKEGQQVLVWDGNVNLDNIPAYDLACFHSNRFICGAYSLQGITHWMPLPQPPKE